MRVLSSRRTETLVRWIALELLAWAAAVFSRVISMLARSVRPRRLLRAADPFEYAAIVGDKWRLG